jgi:excisionase family DNA binding protein
MKNSTAPTSPPEGEPRLSRGLALDTRRARAERVADDATLVENQTEWLTTKQVAKLLNLKPDTVRKKTYSGELKGYRHKGASKRAPLRYRRSEVEEFELAYPNAGKVPNF